MDALEINRLVKVDVKTNKVIKVVLICLENEIGRLLSCLKLLNKQNEDNNVKYCRDILRIDKDMIYANGIEFVFNLKLE